MKSNKSHLLILCLWIALFSCKQKLENSNPQHYFTSLIVKDMDRSINWYSNHLDFKVVKEVELEERGIKQVNLQSASGLLELIELNNSIASDTLMVNYSKGTKIQGFFKVGFLVEDLDLMVVKLDENKDNIVIDPITQKRMIVVRDPDGNRIQLFEK